MSFSQYERYKDAGVEGLGKLPAHWEILKLKRAVQIRYGLGEPPPYREEGVPLIRATNVDSGRITSKNLVLVDPADIPEKRIVWLSPGDIIVVRSGAYTGDSAIIRTRHCPCIAGFDMVVTARSCCSDFLQYALLSSYLKRDQIDLEKMRAAQPHLNAEELGECTLLVPPEDEQLGIVAFLDRETAKIDALVDDQNRLIELLKEKRQAVISHAVTKGLDPNVPMKDSRVEWLGLVPEHWSLHKIKRLFRLVKRPFKEDVPVLSVYREYGVIKKDSRTDNFNKTPEDLTAYQSVQPDDLVINKMKAWQGSLGVSDHCGITSPDYVVYEAQHTQHSPFIHYLLRSARMPGVYLTISNGIRPSQWRLEPDKFEQLPIPLPPTAEQQAIAAYLDTETGYSNALVDEAKQAIALLQERRTSLISAAVTGKIDVRGAAPAAAEAA